MATLVYELRSKDKENSIIQLRFSWKRGVSAFRRSLGISVSVKNWDKNRQRIKVNKETYMSAEKENDFLNELQKYFLSRYNELLVTSVEVTKNDLEKIYLGFRSDKIEVNKSVYFLPFVRNYIDTIDQRKNPRTGKPVGLRSKQDYERTYKSLLNFEKKNKVKLTFSDLDLDFHYDFTKHLNTIDKLENKNTVGAFFKNIRTFVKYAETIGVKINKQTLSKGFYVSSEESPSVYLSEDEITKLFEYDFSKNLRYSNVRDWCVIGCWIGLRVSDWSRIGNIEDDMIIIKPKKTLSTTAVEVVIPLHWQVVEIIEKRGMPKPVSDVEYNRVIKEVCEKVGINVLTKGSLMCKKKKRKVVDVYPKHDLISSHTCRRSFATNLYKSDFPSYSIMQITGHKTEKAFLNYIKVTPKEHALKLKKHWDNYYGRG